MLCLLAGIAFAAGPVPWPRGHAPSPKELDEKVSDAVELAERERMEEFLEAADRGEDSEHIFVLQEDVDANKYNIEQLFQFGDSTFEHEHRRVDGYGSSELPRLQRVQRGSFGGLDSFSCAGCHAKGGVNGAGDASQNAFYFGDGRHTSSAVVRNPPAVLGLGMVQAIGVEMTRDLRRTRDAVQRLAKQQNQTVERPLQSKGVSFGTLRATADGALDTSGVRGVDADLEVKPFGWKGHTARLRRFGERAARIHFGVQSHVLALRHKDTPMPAQLGHGARWWDPDDDEVQREMEEGTLTALAIYMALLEVPVIIPPHDPGLQRRCAAGSELFDRLGCVDCHRRSLPLSSLIWTEMPDTTEGPGVAIQLITDGETPRGEPGVVQLFSDLKRHDMGEVLADVVQGQPGIGRSVFLTRPLWGVAETAPYLHDGRAATLHEAIAAHGGEAATQRSSYQALEDAQRADIHIFLLSLSREPKLRVER
jgi:hypothetical protein